VFAAQQTTTKEETKQAGSSAKDAGKEAGEAAKHAGKATTKAAKQGAHKVKKAVTGDAHATCVDGTRQAGTTEAAAATACGNHGGVAKQ
jgi:hypothetical protein